MENQLIRGQVFDVLFNYAEKWGSICTESDCATVRDEICLRIDQSQFTADEAEDYINQEVEKRIKERIKNLPRYDIVEYDGGMCRHMDGDWLNFEEVRSRLTCSEKPNNSKGGEG